MAEEGGELNLIPYLDIVTNVIMFMLATATFAAALGDINASSPILGPPGEGSTPDKPKQDLNLTVSITEKGFTIAASGAVLQAGFTFDGAGNLVQPPTPSLPTIPKKGTEFDYELLNKKMLEIKRQPTAAGETKVFINANPQITYEKVVAAMDAIRNEGPKVLFPEVLLAAGVN
jgi:biopolymer transport protein TolR